MTYPVVSTGAGATRQVLADHPELMVVAFRFEAGAEGAPHDHPHIQATYVESGSFAFSVGDQTHTLQPGDSLTIPSGVRHGCKCLIAGTLIDTFTPRRDDFL